MEEGKEIKKRGKKGEKERRERRERIKEGVSVANMKESLGNIDIFSICVFWILRFFHLSFDYYF